MITNRKEYIRYLKADEAAFKVSTAGIINTLRFQAGLFFFVEKYILLHYTKLLRKVEWLHYRKNDSLFRKFQYLYALRHYRKMSVRQQISIPLHTTGEGLCILHLGPIIVNSGACLGRFCTLQPGVVIGQKSNSTEVPLIGNHVYFCPGAIVIGKVSIGDYAIIAPNSVVIHNVAPYDTVSGIPAKTIRKNPTATLIAI